MYKIVKLTKIALAAIFCFSGNFRLYGQNSTYGICTTKSKDFVPAGEILFYDDFNDGVLGEIPDNWEIRTLKNWRTLDSSFEKGTITMVDSIKVLRVTDGHLEFLRPVIKSAICDTCYFTFEFDYLQIDTEAVEIHINYPANRINLSTGCIEIHRNGSINVGYLKAVNPNTKNESVENRYKECKIPGGYNSNKWHHFSASLKNKRITICIDSRLVFKDEFINVDFADIDFMDPYVITNLRIAQRRGDSPLKKLMAPGKIETTAIRFVENSGIMKRESFAFIKQLAEFLDLNPALKIQINCFGDGTSKDAKGIDIAQTRSEAIKGLLHHYGINVNRVVAKGAGANPTFNDTKATKRISNYMYVEIFSLR